MTKKLLTMRASDQTVRQIDDLTRWLGTSKTELLTIALDRMHREEADRRASQPAPKQP